MNTIEILATKMFNTVTAEKKLQQYNIACTNGVIIRNQLINALKRENLLREDF